jgi:hypothetical protein
MDRAVKGKTAQNRNGFRVASISSVIVTTARERGGVKGMNLGFRGGEVRLSKPDLLARAQERFCLGAQRAAFLNFRNTPATSFVAHPETFPSQRIFENTNRARTKKL